MRLLFTFTDEHFQHSTMVKKNKTSMKKDNGNLQTINSLKLYRIIMKSTHIFRSMAYFGNEKLLDALIPNQIYLAVANIYRVTFIRLKLLRITAILPRYSISKKKSINKKLLSSSTCVYYKNMKDFHFVWEVNKKNEIKSQIQYSLHLGFAKTLELKIITPTKPCEFDIIIEIKWRGNHPKLYPYVTFIVGF